MNTLFHRLMIATAAMAIASSACAQQQSDAQRAAARSACHDDAQKFCSDVRPGGGRIVQCLEDHSKDVSDACYDILQKFEDRRKSNAGGGNESGSAPSR